MEHSLLLRLHEAAECSGVALQQFVQDVLDSLGKYLGPAFLVKGGTMLVLSAPEEFPLPCLCFIELTQ